MAFYRPAHRRRCPALTSGSNYTKLGFLCFCRAFHLNRALETGRHHYYQIGTVLAVFWRFFDGFSAGSKTTVSCAYPLTELHQTRFLGLLQAIPPESGVRIGKIPVLADYPNFARWSIFGVFSASSKTTRSCAYLWTELHQTRFPGLFQAIPPESSVRIGKIPVLADYPNFAPWSNFWRFFRPAPRRRCPSLTPGPNRTKLDFLGFCTPFHLNRALETGRHHY